MVLQDLFLNGPMVMLHILLESKSGKLICYEHNESLEIYLKENQLITKENFK